MSDKRLITNDKSIAKYKPSDKDYFVKVADHTGLFLRVYPNGNRIWVYQYTPKGTRTIRKITIGNYPAISLSMAMDKWAVYHELRQKDIDPQQWQENQKQQKAIDDKNKFNLVCHEWASLQSWGEKTRQKRESRLNLMCGYLGNQSMKKITTAQIVDMLQDIENTHRQAKDPSKPSEVANRCRGMIIDIFAWAKIKGYCTDNPTADIKATKSHHTAQNAEYGHRPAITDPKTFGVLLAKLDNATMHPATRHNLKLLAYLAVRNCDIRHMRWADLDFDKCLWTFDPIKGQSMSKIKMVKRHSVPLSRQVIAILKEQQKLTGLCDYVFDNGKGGVISDGTVQRNLNRQGYQNVHCVHGFRASAKTMLMQELDYNDLITEMVLGHTIKANNDPYLRADLLERRRELMQTWANYIDDLQACNDTDKHKGIYRQNPNDILNALLAMKDKDEIIKMLERL